VSLTGKVFIIICAIIYIISVLKLLVHKKINERNTIYGLLGIFLIILLASLPGILDRAAYMLGIDYPPALLFLITVLVLLYMVMKQAGQISELDDKVKELAQIIAISKESNNDKNTKEV